jgi:CheY-specific phosphatase CheX
VSPGPDIVAIGDFLATVVGVLHQYGVGAAVDGMPSGNSTRIDIAVVIHVRGDLSRVTWRFPVAIARRAATTMAPDLPLDPPVLEAAAAELANVLTGRGATTLAGHGIRIDIEPPDLSGSIPGGVVGLLATELGTIKVMFHGAASA